MKYNDYIDRKKYINDVVVPALKVNGFDKKADCINNCGEFKRLAMCNDCGTLYFNGFSSCKDRYCPLCQKKKSLLWQLKVLPILQEYADKKNSICMVTFTIKNTKTLKDGIKVMREAWRYMTHQCKMYKLFWDNSFIGGVRTLEVKLSDKREWHPHFHMLAIKEKYKYDFFDIMKMWDDSVHYVAEKYNIYDKDTDFEDNENYKYGSVEVHLVGGRKWSLNKSIREVFKYITKFDWWAVDKVKELIEGLYRVVSISSWGCLYDIKQKVEEQEDLSLTEIEERYCTICGSDNFDTNTFKYVHAFDLNDGNIHDFKRLTKRPYTDMVTKSYLKLLQGNTVNILGKNFTSEDLIRYNIKSLQDFKSRLLFYKETGNFDNYQLFLDRFMRKTRV